MTATDPSMTALANSWSALSLLHGRIENRIESALQSGHELSVREYSLLDVLNRQHDGEGGHLQMRQVADAVVLSQSATTRLVTRLEDRGLLSRYLCPTDRRGIYTDVTAAGRNLLEEARPTHNTALREALDEAAAEPVLAPLVDAIRQLQDGDRTDAAGARRDADGGATSRRRPPRADLSEQRVRSRGRVSSPLVCREGWSAGTGFFDDPGG